MSVAPSMSEFLSRSEDYTYKLADNLLDAMTRGEHSRSLAGTERVSARSSSSSSSSTCGGVHKKLLVSSLVFVSECTIFYEDVARVRVRVRVRVRAGDTHPP